MDTTILKGLTVLESLAESDQPRGVTELSRQLNLSKSNVQRLLRTLVDLGYAQQDGATGRYAPTLRMWEFGYKTLSRDRVKLAAGAYIRKLSERVNETVFLCVGDGPDIIYIDRVDTTDPSRVFCVVGMRVPSLKTAAGRAVVAYQGEAVINRAVQALLEERPEKADQIADIHQDLSNIRGQSFALSLGDFRPGVSSIAAPLWSGGGKVVGSVTITGSDERLPKERLLALKPDVAKCAVEISEALGFRLA